MLPFRAIGSSPARSAAFSDRLRGQIALGDTLVPGPTQSKSFIAQRRHLTSSLFSRGREENSRD